MSEIVQQLKDFCDCFDDKELEEEFLEKNVTELIFLISLLTCWTQKPCETFLNSEREEIFTVEDIARCGCQKGIIEVVPFYDNYTHELINPETLRVRVIKTLGIEDIEEELDVSKFAYSKRYGVIRIDLSDYLNSQCICSCDNLKSVVVTYDAGYQEIPECLLELFCNLLHVVTDKNNCTCASCQTCKQGSVDDASIVFDDEVSKDLDVYVTRLIESGYQKQLGLMSICKRSCGFLGEVI